MAAMWQDLHYSWRKLWRAPLFTLVSILMLALGLAASVATFSVVDAVLLSPLPYAEPDRLALVWGRMWANNSPKAPVTAPDVQDFRDQSQLFESFAATNNVKDATVTGDADSEQIKLASVTANFFSVLGVPPRLGRDFRPEEEVPIPPEDPEGTAPAVAPSAVILAHHLWQRHFGGDPGAIDQVLRINGQPMTVVGVMPPDFKLWMPIDAGMAKTIDAWTPLRLELGAGARDHQFLRVIGRLKPGVSLAQAQKEMDSIATRQREQFQFHNNLDIHLEVRSMLSEVAEHVRPALLALFATVGFVLLIACLNVAQLLFAQSRGREREMALRVAVGAAPRRLVAQLLTEGLLLSLLAAAVGLPLARGAVYLLGVFKPADLPRLASVAFDARVLGFTLLAILLTVLVFALTPALLTASRSRVAVSQGRQSRVGTPGLRRLSSLLVIVEIGLSLMLLIGAGLMVRSFQQLREVRPGFDPEGVLTYKLSLSPGRYPEADQRIELYRRMEERVAALPGVREVGMVYPLPLGGRFSTGPYGKRGEDLATWSLNEGNFRHTTPGFLEAMSAKLVAGRLLEEGDFEPRRKVVVIDHLMAERVWPGEDPIGQELGIDLRGTVHWLEVVGVVGHLRHVDLKKDRRETAFFPYHLAANNQMIVVVKTDGDPANQLQPIREQVKALDAQLPVYGVRLMQDYVDDGMAVTRFSAMLTSLFAVIALILAVVGLYGILSYLARQQTQEIGIRMALGATPKTILTQIVAHGFRLTVLGLGMGLLGTVALTRAMRSLLFGVEPNDPWTFALLSILLFIVALTASSLPALRASKIDPVDSLRSET